MLAVRIPRKGQATAFDLFAEGHHIVELHLFEVIERGAALLADINAQFLHDRGRHGRQGFGLNARAIDCIALRLEVAQQPLGHLRAVGVAITEKQDANGLVHAVASVA